MKLRPLLILLGAIVACGFPFARVAAQEIEEQERTSPISPEEKKAEKLAAFFEKHGAQQLYEDKLKAAEIDFVKINNGDKGELQALKKIKNELLRDLKSKAKLDKESEIEAELGKHLKKLDEEPDTNEEPELMR